MIWRSPALISPWFGRTKYCLGLVVLILNAIVCSLRLWSRSCFVEYWSGTTLNARSAGETSRRHGSPPVRMQGRVSA
jgi:hypothetical protein